VQIKVNSYIGNQGLNNLEVLGKTNFHDFRRYFPKPKTKFFVYDGKVPAVPEQDLTTDSNQLDLALYTYPSPGVTAGASKLTIDNSKEDLMGSENKLVTVTDDDVDVEAFISLTKVNDAGEELPE